MTLVLRVMGSWAYIRHCAKQTRGALITAPRRVREMCAAEADCHGGGAGGRGGGGGGGGSSGREDVLRNHGRFPWGKAIPGRGFSLRAALTMGDPGIF